MYLGDVGACTVSGRRARVPGRKPQPTPTLDVDVWSLDAQAQRAAGPRAWISESETAETRGERKTRSIRVALSLRTRDTSPPSPARRCIACTVQHPSQAVRRSPTPPTCAPSCTRPHVSRSPYVCRISRNSARRVQAICRLSLCAGGRQGSRMTRGRAKIQYVLLALSDAACYGGCYVRALGSVSLAARQQCLGGTAVSQRHSGSSARQQFPGGTVVFAARWQCFANSGRYVVVFRRAGSRLYGGSARGRGSSVEC